MSPKPPLFALLPLLPLAWACGEPTAAPSIPVDLECAAPTATDAEEAVSLYEAGLTQADDTEAPCLLQRSLADNIQWIDEGGSVRGRPDVRLELEAYAEALRADGKLRDLTRPPVFRHREALVAWTVVDDAGVTTDAGEDWIELADDGRIETIHTFHVTGREIPLPSELSAWEHAWNVRDEAEQRENLRIATTENVRFTDLLVDVESRESILTEIRRQQEILGGTLDLGDTVMVHAGTIDDPITIRHEAKIVLPNGVIIDISNFIRLRDGRIERLSGYPYAS